MAVGWTEAETYALIGYANVQSQLGGVQRNQVIYE